MRYAPRVELIAQILNPVLQVHDLVLLRPDLILESLTLDRELFDFALFSFGRLVPSDLQRRVVHRRLRFPGIGRAAAIV